MEENKKSNNSELESSESYDLVIAGGGIVAFASSIYAARFAMKTAIVGDMLGGAIVMTDKVENYPGFKQISGIELFNRIKDHALSYDVSVYEEKVKEIAKENSTGLFKIRTDKKELTAKAVIIATGTERRKLNVPGEKEFNGNGVHYCALCDGYLYSDKVVAVIGGSDSAVKEALILSGYASKVYIIYRGEQLRAEPINLKKLKSSNNIEVITNTNVLEIKGTDVVSSVVLDNSYNGSKELKLDAVFIEIGHVPMFSLAKKLGINLNEKGEIIVDRESRTNITRVYAAGDVTDIRFKQAITGVAQGINAVFSAYNDIKRMP